MHCDGNKRQRSTTTATCSSDLFGCITPERSAHSTCPAYYLSKDSTACNIALVPLKYSTGQSSCFHRISYLTLHDIVLHDVTACPYTAVQSAGPTQHSMTCEATIHYILPGHITRCIMTLHDTALRNKLLHRVRGRLLYPGLTYRSLHQDLRLCDRPRSWQGFVKSTQKHGIYLITLVTSPSHNQHHQDFAIFLRVGTPRPPANPAQAAPWSRAAARPCSPAPVSAEARSKPARNVWSATPSRSRGDEEKPVKARQARQQTELQTSKYMYISHIR